MKNNICKIKECKDKVKTKGWCNKHYRSWLKYGNPLFTKHHGYSRHPLYTVWRHMKDRCYNKNGGQYKDYGGRGIVVCDEWFNNAKIFINWALPLWRKGLQIDRKNNDGNYCSENCRFVTRAENMHNTRLLMNTNISGYRGVYYDKISKQWKAQISINNKKKYIGYFNSAKKAALGYDNAVPDNRPKNFKGETQI
jgi:hypothetical protein